MQTILAILNFIGFEGAGLLGMIGVWLRIEHRLSKIETKIEDLPCKGRAECQ